MSWYQHMKATVVFRTSLQPPAVVAATLCMQDKDFVRKNNRKQSVLSTLYSFGYHFSLKFQCTITNHAIYIPGVVLGLSGRDLVHARQ